MCAVEPLDNINPSKYVQHSANGYFKMKLYCVLLMMPNRIPNIIMERKLNKPIIVSIDAIKSIMIKSFQ